MDRQAYYEALCSHDSRFDGKFFVGVRSTGIYCRPVCRVRTPKEENCTFFLSAAEAEAAGYRPCLKCRPELAPGSSTLESSSDLAKAAAREIEANCGNEESLAELAVRLGCTDRHLRRVFEAEFRVTPLQYRQTCRLLLAKKLLTDTRLSVMEVAMASGFGSLRRFNTVFEREYKLTPSTLRKQVAGQAECADGFTVKVGYRPPYRWQEMLRFLSARSIPGVEMVRDGTWYRTVRIREHTGWIRVEQHEAKNTLAVTVSASLLRVLPQVLAKVRRLFDTDSDPQTIAEALKDMRQIREALPICGLRVPGCFDAFETCVRAILGQQITVKAANTLAGRIVQAMGRPVESGIEGLTHTFPTADDVLDAGAAALGELGVIHARGEAVLELAERFRQREALTRDKLLAIKGIGPWTADYIAIRVLGEPDAFLPTDYGVKTALAPRTQKEMAALAEDWRPWRSYAVMNLWNI
ncbi:MAG: helix-turn-helix domain-containing protein [Oscillospiraceae bacterium]|nr:helix-turn-helix domain-containing protein [Oscillospiraceae bacterium]